MKKIIFISLLVGVIFAGCAKAETPTTTSTSMNSSVSTSSAKLQESEVEPVTFNKITPEEGKQMMEENSSIILLDVRTQEEFEEGHIENAILLPDFELSEQIQEVVPEKDATIIVYCRSGRRSSASAMDLISMGYTNVYDMGGILSWPFEIVQ